MSIQAGVPLDLEQLRSAGIAICAIVELAIEPPRPDFEGNKLRPLQQVVLRPDKISPQGLIRLGETPGDEANCWTRPEHVNVIEILGEAVQDASGKWNVRPADTGSAQKAA